MSYLAYSLPDNSMELLLLKNFWVGFTCSLICAYPIYRVLLSLKSRQTVSQYAPETHQVKQGTPTMGGLIIVAGLLIGGLIVGLPWTELLLVFLFALIGFTDDFVVPRLMPGKRGLGWKQKILMQFVAAGFVAVLDGWGWRWTGLSFFLVLFFSNAYNFSDGLDGLAASIASLFLIGLACIGWPIFSNLQHPQLTASYLPAIVLCFGTMIPFSFMNAPKAKIFMGDAGSLPIGALLGWLLAQLLKGYVEKSHWTDTVHVPQLQFYAALVILSFVLIAELVPVPLQIFWVKVFKRKLFLYTPIHHAFEKICWPETRVVWCFALTQLLCVAAAWTLVAFQ